MNELLWYLTGAKYNSEPLREWDEQYINTVAVWSAYNSFSIRERYEDICRIIYAPRY